MARRHELTQEDRIRGALGLTREEAVLNGTKGGIESGKSRRAAKQMSELANMIASAKISNEKLKADVKSLGIKNAGDLTNQAAVVASVYMAAISGDMKAVEKWQELTEVKDAETTEAGVFEIPARLIASPYFDVHLDISEHGHTEYVQEGGRGSAKSSFISLEIVALIKSHPQMHAVVARKVGNTLRDSVFSQVEWAIDALGLNDEFERKVSPMEITYKATGQKIYFRGADDPIKLKSIKPTFGYIGILWLEELDQFGGDEECRNIQQSVIRGGDTAYIFKSFNPPQTRNNWANQYILQAKATMMVTHTTYLQVPGRWLGKAFLDEAEYLKEVNPSAYEHEYLGIANGNGGMVFENLELREITDEEISHMDRIYQGVDWGFAPDPFAFIRAHYDKARETIYLLDELYVNKWSNTRTAEWIKERGYTDAYITCDSAEPKSVADFRASGLPAKEAIKGPGSVEHGMKWLQVRKIVIDQRRTPNAYKEFVYYEYERSKNGDIISGYPDENNHLIDSLRYAMERMSRRYGSSA